MNAPSNAPSMCGLQGEVAMHVRTDVRTNADASSPTAAISPSVTRAPAYGDFAAGDLGATCQHREATRHFVWVCTGPADHGGRGHVLRATPLVAKEES